MLALRVVLATVAAFAVLVGCSNSIAQPQPLLKSGAPVDWWFVFKLNAKSFPECGGAQRSCIFDTGVKPFPYKAAIGMQYLFTGKSGNDHVPLSQGAGCVGDTKNDPIGATFDEIYNGKYYYVVWNDQYDKSDMHLRRKRD
jgi:hypothetical protein